MQPMPAQPLDPPRRPQFRARKNLYRTPRRVEWATRGKAAFLYVHPTRPLELEISRRSRANERHALIPLTRQPGMDGRWQHGVRASLSRKMRGASRHTWHSVLRAVPFARHRRLEVHESVPQSVVGVWGAGCAWPALCASESAPAAAATILRWGSSALRETRIDHVIRETHQPQSPSHGLFVCIICYQRGWSVQRV